MPQIGLDTKTYWLTDRQSQCDFDLSQLITVSQSVSSQLSEEEEIKGRLRGKISEGQNSL
jgi:hypothetical protein